MTNKRLISLRVSPIVLDWFRSASPKGYQTLMHSVLADYVDAQLKQAERRAGRAQELFRHYYAQCFWHCDPELKITPANVDLVAAGLRKYGGREGFQLAEELCR